MATFLIHFKFVEVVGRDFFIRGYRSEGVEKYPAA